MKGYKCKKCFHKWIGRTDNPIQCPRCKRYNWNIKKKEEKIDLEEEEIRILEHRERKQEGTT